MSKIKKESSISRRDFVNKTLAASAAFTIVPSFAVSGLGHVAPSDKLNIAGIGVGGMGLANLKNLTSQNIVGLCDVDWKYAKGAFDMFPKAKKYWDWRKMYEEMENEIDAVVIATADIFGPTRHGSS